MYMEINLGNTKGVIRKVDSQSRVIIPKSFLERIGIKKSDDKVEIFLTKNGIFIRKGE